MIAIIVSQQDPAGLNVKDKLINSHFKETGETFQDSGVYEFQETKLYTVKDRPIFAENIDKQIDARYFIFATTHRAASSVTSLSVHPIGNWGKAELGGQEGKIVPALPLLMRKAYLKLQELNNQDFQITMEATHHGPYLEKPTLFIEIGSDETNWRNPEAGKIIAETIIHMLDGEPEKVPVAFAIGGAHYCPNFNKRLDKIAVGHVCPKHALEFLNKEMMRQVMQKSPFDFAALDWKGLSPHKQRILEILDELNIEYKRSDRV